jgi:hypothetical protein
MCRVADGAAERHTHTRAAEQRRASACARARAAARATTAWRPAHRPTRHPRTKGTDSTRGQAALLAGGSTRSSELGYKGFNTISSHGMCFAQARAGWVRASERLELGGASLLDRLAAAPASLTFTHMRYEQPLGRSHVRRRSQGHGRREHEPRLADGITRQPGEQRGCLNEERRR